MEALIEGGVDVLILETFTQRGDLRLALQVAKAVSDVPVVCQMAFPERLREEEEHQIIQTLLQLRDEGADVIGGNCGFGPLHLLRAMEHIATHHDALLSAFPNTGFPHYLEGRYVYLSEPEYFADNAVRFAEIGVNLIGGCCGTTPEHIRLVAERLHGRAPTPRRIEPLPPPRPAVEIVAPPPAVPNLLDRLGQEKIIIVELDPPRGSLNYEKVIGSARILKDEGVHAISIAENPLASLRMSSFVLSYLVQRETGLTAVCHCACRDRNLLGQQSELMGASVLGINTILAITGDPTTLGNVHGASSVFDTNSFGLVEMLRTLNQGINAAGRSIDRPTNFTIGVAFNPNRARIEAEIKRLRKKVDLGAQFAMSQMVYDAARVEEMYAKTADVGIPIFVGFMPLVSARNAEFLHHEVPGFKIPEGVIQRMKEAGEDKQRAVETGLEIIKELIDVAFAAGAPGIYLVTPFGRVELMVELVRHIRRR
jgi:homocysteine S-methyltransferase